MKFGPSISISKREITNFSYKKLRWPSLVTNQKVYQLWFCTWLSVIFTRLLRIFVAKHAAYMNYRVAPQRALSIHPVASEACGGIPQKQVLNIGMFDPIFMKYCRSTVNMWVVNAVSDCWQKRENIAARAIRFESGLEVWRVCDVSLTTCFKNDVSKPWSFFLKFLSGTNRWLSARLQ